MESLTVDEFKSNEHKKIKKEHYNEINRQNEIFADYYKRQRLVPEEEWEELMKYLATNLPTTFRLTGHRQEEALLTLKQFQTYLPTLGSNVKWLPWYEPKGYAWHLENDRKSVRTDERLTKLHRWMVAATENGDINRQEAVSMIPPLLLDVRSDHLVLDLCAAPGSKTAQLVEKMHADAKNSTPRGLVVANDSDQQRAYMLYHQVKRILSPCLLVTNNDGCIFPTLVRHLDNGKFERAYFDRILADVPCSGDGTLRKNALLWKTWTPNHALGLHPLQIRLLEKAIRLLKVGGRLVYSTCSMNFIENEAVLAHVLNKYRHALKLVNVSGDLPELNRRPGRCTWKVISKEGLEFSTFDQVPKEQQKRFPPSVFPQSEYVDLGLEQCLRIYPHLQNTGGFFVAVLEKFADIDVKSSTSRGDEERDIAEPLEEKKTTPRPSRFSKPGDNEFRLLDINDDPVLQNIFDWYGIDREQLSREEFGFFVRSARDPIKTIVVVSSSAYRILTATVQPHRKVESGSLYNRSLRIVNSGVRVFEIYETNRAVNIPCVYRPLFESISMLRPFMTKRIARIEPEDVIRLLNTEDSVRIPLVEKELGEGGAILETTILQSNLTISVPVWISERGVKTFVAQANRPALLSQLELQ